MMPAQQCPFAAASQTATEPKVEVKATQPEETEEKPCLYKRLGGYDDISPFAGHLLKRCIQDEHLGRFWATMSEDTFHKEHTNFVDFCCVNWGGQHVYRGRDMFTTHRGMGITEKDWDVLMRICDDCYDEMDVPQDIREELTAFLTKYKGAVVGGPSFREAVIATPDMDVRKNMKDYGITKKTVL